MPLPEISDILNLREKFDVNQKELAKLAGVDYAWLSQVLTKRIKDPSYKKMKKIFDYLEVRQYQGGRTAEEICARPIFTAKLRATLGIISQTMRKKGYSHVPIFDGKICVGLLTDEKITEMIVELVNLDVKMFKINKQMLEPAPPIIPHDTPALPLKNMLKYFDCIIVEKNGKSYGIITHQDMHRLLD